MTSMAYTPNLLRVGRSVLRPRIFAEILDAPVHVRNGEYERPRGHFRLHGGSLGSLDRSILSECPCAINQCRSWINLDKTQSEHNESAFGVIATETPGC
jgi:hypothetical protein